MRVLTAALIILTLMFSNASAIQRVYDPWDGGFKAGLSLSDYYNCDDCISDSKTGFTGGVYGQYRVSPNFSFQPELLFVMKGWSNRDNNVNLSYLELPVLLKLKIVPSADLAPTFFAGPAGAILISANSEGWELDDLFNWFDFGVVAGVGLDITAGAGTFSLEARYTLGLTAIPDDNIVWDFMGGIDGDVPDIKNKTISFMIGLGW